MAANRIWKRGGFTECSSKLTNDSNIPKTIRWHYTLAACVGFHSPCTMQCTILCCCILCFCYDRKFINSPLLVVTIRYVCCVLSSTFSIVLFLFHCEPNIQQKSIYIVKQPNKSQNDQRKMANKNKKNQWK